METAIVERLAGDDRIKPLKVAPWPDSAADFPGAVRQGGVFVGYTGSRFGQPTTDVIAQDATAEWQIVLSVKALRGPGGAYPYLEAVRALLTGFEPAGGGLMYPIDERFDDQLQGAWVYTLVFNNGYVHVPDAPTSDDPTFTRGSFQLDGTTTVDGTVTRDDTGKATGAVFQRDFNQTQEVPLV